MSQCDRDRIPDFIEMYYGAYDNIGMNAQVPRQITIHTSGTSSYYDDDDDDDNDDDGWQVVRRR